jgi:DNA polymerase sigma
MYGNFVNKQADGSKRARRLKQNKINRATPKNNQEKYRISEMSRRLEARLARSAMTAKESAYITEATQRLEEVVSQLGSQWCARPFGSMASTFRTRDSDVDVTCLCKDGLHSGQTQASILGQKLSPLFHKHPRFTVVEEVLHAKVPILKLLFDDQLEIDLSCQNSQAVQNTRLLRAYAELDRRVRDFVIAVKLWAKSADVCGASRGRLSSYAFTLLAIYFLQVHPEVQLPCIPTGAFSEDCFGEDDEKVVNTFRGRWSCTLSTAELLQRFFCFYANGFQWGAEVVSVRSGQRRFTVEPLFGALRGRHLHRMHIEDPYVLERNLHCVLKPEEEGTLQQAFAEAAYCFDCDVLPVGLNMNTETQQQQPLEGGLSGNSTLMSMLQIGKSSTEDPLSDTAASTAAAYDSRSSDNGSGDEAPLSETQRQVTPPSNSKHRCSSLMDSVVSTAASTASLESHSDPDNAAASWFASISSDKQATLSSRWADIDDQGSMDASAKLLLEQWQHSEVVEAEAPWWRQWTAETVAQEAEQPLVQQPKVMTLEALEADMKAQQQQQSECRRVLAAALGAPVAPAMMTLQDVEGMLGATAPIASDEKHGGFDFRAFFARPRASRATDVIATRAAKACLGLPE